MNTPYSLSSTLSSSLKRALPTLLSADYFSIGRDPLLRWTLVYLSGFALAVRWIFPLLLTRLEVRIGVSLSPWYDPIMQYALLTITPLLTGYVAGFLLLDQKDDGTLSALAVTPLGLQGYLIYRLALPVALSTCLVFPLMPLAGLPMAPARLVLASLAAAPLAPMLSLALGALARDKVQGFALVKVAGVALPLALGALFVPLPWQRLFWLLPQYWPGRCLWTASSVDALLAAAIAIAYQGALVYWLARYFTRSNT